ncbi:MAG: nicotinate-nucleotide--dimethylbenzimidazole phosphoribosyltransferase [Bacteroides sp.]
MMQFEIEKPNEEILPYLRDQIDNLTKPKGSLGFLEQLALQIAWVQQTRSPTLQNPHHIVFAADHGIAEENISLSPQEVTYQMLLNFKQGGAGVNFLARQHHFKLMLVDVGVNKDLDLSDQSIIHRKIRKQTRNYRYEAAMTTEELEQALKVGADCVRRCKEAGCNILCLGEMGITNTSSSALWMHYLTGVSLRQCIGAGSDHSGQILEHKYEVLKSCRENYSGDGSALDVMQYFGGYEMVAAVGAMLEAAQLKMLILVDGFIMTNCMLMASKLNKQVLHYAIYGHEGDETGHAIALKALNAQPILKLGLRLGEGTGALCAYPIVESAVRMINEMSSFKEVQVTKYF